MMGVMMAQGLNHDYFLIMIQNQKGIECQMLCFEFYFESISNALASIGDLNYCELLIHRNVHKFHQVIIDFMQASWKLTGPRQT